MSKEIEEKDEEKLEESESVDEKEVEDQDDESDQSDTPADDEVTSRLKSFEAQLERQRYENEALRESVRLQSRLLEQSNQGNRSQGSELSPELQELKKAISPLLGEDIRSSMQPIIGTVSQLYDQNDAVSFQLQLQRESPDNLKEDNFNRISQVVDSVRQKAVQQSNTWLSRNDAYLYAKGAGLLKPVSVSKANKQGQLNKQKAAAQGTTGQSDTKQIPGAQSAEITRIKAKAQAGILLTDAERTKFRDSLGDSAF